MLPDTVTEVRYRADSASYNHDLMDALKPGLLINGRRVKVIFAISADMSDSLKGTVEELPEEAWKPLRKVADKGLVVGRKDWAEVVFVPSRTKEKKNDTPDRYLAIRVKPSQGELFSDGNAYRYYAVVTNNWQWDGERLLRWHREKCGTVERVFDVLKNDLGAGVMPCGRFYANAAWWRLNCIAYNVLSVMKRKALPSEWWTWRMKALRFFLISAAGRIIRTGRSVYLRFAGMASVLTIYQDARERLGHLYDTA
jgi:hypothetical protein